MKPLVLYRRILRYFGPQGWWPILEKRKGEWTPVYKKRPRLTSGQMFEIAVGAILTQNAAWKNAAKALINLKKSRLLKPDALNKVKQKRLAGLIRPSGYYNQKAKKLKAFSNWLKRGYLGDLKVFFRNELAQCRNELLGLYGLGPETSDSILLYAGGKQVFVVDTYTKRWLKVFHKQFSNYDEYRNWFETELPKKPSLYNEYHALIVAWAKLYRKHPRLARRLLKYKIKVDSSEKRFKI
ncbi:MAG: hypothetical protein PHH01_02155 [Patescibacteria group bacterium]|nr:hypothetical protein [Patescibacteria group bacterium]